MKPEKTYFTMELVGTSKKSIEDAIHGALADAHKKVKTVRWFEVIETRGHVQEGTVAYYQVMLKLGYSE